MMERQLHAFVDESGVNQLNSSFDGVSHLFILVAVVVDDEQRLVAERQLDAVSKDFFGGAELKSSKIAGDIGRRLRVLNAIKDIDFGYYALIVNKDMVPKDSGYQWKKPFYKATRRRMYAKLTGSLFDKLSIHSDRIGSQNFMDSFAAYLSDITAPNLFYPAVTHSFVESTRSRLIQLADLIAGSLNYCFDSSRSSELAPQFRSILTEKELSIDVWPVTLTVTDNQQSVDGDIDEMIYSSLLEKVTRYMTDLADLGDNGSDEDKMREAVLSRLLYARLYNDRKDQAVYSDKLIELLVSLGYEKLAKQVFTSTVIGKIRDAGIIIAGTSLGYRLALSADDIGDYVMHNNSVVLPMLSRIEIARGTIKAATLNRHDILESHEILRELVGLFRDKQLEIRTVAHVEADDDVIDA